MRLWVCRGIAVIYLIDNIHWRDRDVGAGLSLRGVDSLEDKQSPEADRGRAVGQRGRRGRQVVNGPVTRFELVMIPVSPYRTYG